MYYKVYIYIYYSHIYIYYNLDTITEVPFYMIHVSFIPYTINSLPGPDHGKYRPGYRAPRLRISW